MTRRISGGKPVSGLAGKPQAKTKRVYKYGSTTCSVCEQEVPLREDGKIKGHRVGSQLQGKWPCRGASNE